MTKIYRKKGNVVNRILTSILMIVLLYLAFGFGLIESKLKDEEAIYFIACATGIMIQYVVKALKYKKIFKPEIKKYLNLKNEILVSIATYILIVIIVLLIPYGYKILGGLIILFFAAIIVENICDFIKKRPQVILKDEMLVYNYTLTGSKEVKYDDIKDMIIYNWWGANELIIIVDGKNNNKLATIREFFGFGTNNSIVIPYNSLEAPIEEIKELIYDYMYEAGIDIDSAFVNR